MAELFWKLLAVLTIAVAKCWMCIALAAVSLGEALGDAQDFFIMKAERAGFRRRSRKPR